MHIDLQTNPNILIDRFVLVKQKIGRDNIFYKVLTPFGLQVILQIIDLIKKVLGTYSSTELQTLYESIDSGKFKSASIATNQFTNQANTGINVNANKIIPKARIANFETCKNISFD